MKKAIYKRRRRAIPILIFIFLLLTTCFASCAEAKESSLPISPALSCIASQNEMAKSALVGSPISFAPEDFARAANLPEIKEITVTQVPPISDGQLRVGSTVLNSGQTVSATSVSLMTYVPASNISKSEFRFKIDGAPYEMTCKLYMLSSQNYAPTLSSAPKNAFEVSTYRGIAYFGTLGCYDPDGDTTCIEIVSQPEKGLLILDDKQTGSYRYIPYSDSTGKDSFTYVAKDIYGNYSASATVSLSIVKQDTNTRFVDLEDSPYHNSAIAMTEKGIMGGTQVGSALYFYPETTVTRAEFVTMAMNAAGITDVGSSDTTTFSDDADIPSQMRKYIATAQKLGYVNGTEIDGKLCFNPNSAVTRAEAAVILAKMLDADIPTVKPVLEDSEAIPTWAEGSLYAMNALGVIKTEENSISPTAAVDRGEAALMLTALIGQKS